MKYLLALFAAVLLSACGSKIEGTYSDQLGLVDYEFRSGGKVYMRTLGTETALNYSVDGDKVTIELPQGGNQVFTLLENGHLQGPLNISLTRKNK
ncbi:MAG TPA: hypothetical protein PLW86_15450 [Rhodocyclaceae bacterium]|nr:hypothetical protein [Rhodocyclaceae bacterium]